MRKLLLISFIALTAVLGTRRTAEAVPIVFGGAQGLTFSLQSVVATTDLYVADGLNDTYLFTVQLDTTLAYNDATRPYLQSISLDVGANIDQFVLQSFPAGTSWSAEPADKGIHATNGTCNSNVDGAVCSEETPAPPGLTLDAVGSYQWVFKIDLNDATGPTINLLLQYATADIKATGAAQWEDTLVSDELRGDGSLDLPLQPLVTPEPSSMLLLGTGIAGLIAYRRKLRRS